MEGLVLGEKDAGDWAYRGEGACNLVLAYTGSSPSFVNQKIKPYHFSNSLHNYACMYVCAYVCMYVLMYVQMGKVMRVKKVPRVGSAGSRSPTALSEKERVLWKEIDDIVSCPNKEIAAQLFVEHVMSSLLGSKYVDSGVCSTMLLSLLCFVWQVRVVIFIRQRRIIL